MKILILILALLLASLAHGENESSGMPVDPTLRPFLCFRGNDLTDRIEPITWDFLSRPSVQKRVSSFGVLHVHFPPEFADGKWWIRVNIWSSSAIKDYRLLQERSAEELDQTFKKLHDLAQNQAQTHGHGRSEARYQLTPKDVVVSSFDGVFGVLFIKESATNEEMLKRCQKL